MRRLREARADLEREVRAGQRRWQYHVHRRRVRFESAVARRHARLRQGLGAFLRESNLLNALTAPLIYSLAVPLVLLDMWVTAFQWVCFPVFGVARVRRRDYLVVDRHMLRYLNGIERVNCVYCGYANGVLAYVREVAARTEQYWCPIKHSRPIRAPHSRYHTFFEFGDAGRYRRELGALRQTMRREADAVRKVGRRRTAARHLPRQRIAR